MLYIGFSILLLFLSKVNRTKDSGFLFNLLFSLFIVLLSIRYGQGTDYFSYKRIFNAASTEYDSFWIKCFLLGVEPFYYALNIFAKRTGLGFLFVIVFSSIITGYFHYKTIRTYSKSYLLSFFILFTNYFVYLNTAIRQGIAISITTYAIFCFLDKKNLIKYILLCLFAMMFHTSAFICLFVPFFLKVGKVLKITRLSHYVPLAVISITAGFFLFRLMILVAGMILSRYSAYQNSSSSLSALLPVSIRISFAVLALRAKSEHSANFSRTESDVLVLYLMGSIFFYMLFSSNQASRLTDYFTILEVIYFANAFPIKAIRKKTLTLCLTVFLFLTLFIKDLNAIQNQGEYYSKNPLNYPYITIFNKKAILDYRGDTKRMPDSLLFD